MQTFELEKIIKRIMQQLALGMQYVSADCATESKHEYHRELFILAAEDEYQVTMITLAGAMALVKKTVGSVAFDTVWTSEVETTFYANTIRIVATYDRDLQGINFVFTDRKDEVGKAGEVASAYLTKLMSTI